MTHDTDAASDSSTLKINWRKRCFYTLWVLWLLGSMLLTVYAVFSGGTEAYAVQVFPRYIEAGPWYILAGLAALLAVAVICISCCRLFAAPNETLEEIKGTLAEIHSMEQKLPFDD